MKSLLQLRQERDYHKAEARRITKLMRKRTGAPAKRKGIGVRIGDRDEAEKLRRGYVERGSVVRRDGSEKLVGRDWKRRKREIWERGGGRCERVIGEVTYRDGTLEDVRCNGEMHDPHHIKERRRGRDDRAENLIGLCRLHHDLLDPRKVRSAKGSAGQQSAGGA